MFWQNNTKPVDSSKKTNKNLTKLAMKNLIIKALLFGDVVLMIFTYPAALLIKIIRKVGVHRLPLSRNALMQVGVFPILNHYYEPQFDYRNLKADCSRDRNLQGIDWNIPEQLTLLGRFKFSEEIMGLQGSKSDDLEFYFNNNSFESGDAEYWYQIIRSLKPKRIFEIGSGNSTLMAIKAIEMNRKEDSNYKCDHVCIEPYEMPWLEKSGVSLIRKKVEEIDLQFFSKLGENDILFIDSSHVIRPEGDVVFEYLEILPSLNKGVIVHIHDIFSPKNYLKDWLVDEVKFWNEQYLVEAFVSHNSCWKIIGALNLLRHKHYDKLKMVAPFLTPDREPGSFYIQRIA
jgi:hypothetical protein